MEKHKEYIGKVDDVQVQSWKNAHGDVYAVTVEGSICYLKKPDRQTFRAITSVGQSDPIRGNEILLDNCWLGGDESIKTNDEKFFAVSGQLAKIIEIKQSDLKKL